MSRSQQILSIALLFSIVVASAAETATSRRPSREVSRASLAAAYLRFDHTLQARWPADDEEVARLNRGFDTLTFAFFMGNMRLVLESIDKLYLSMLDEPSASTRLAVALAVEPEPPIWQPRQPATVTIRPLYEPDGDAVGEIRLTLRLVLDGRLVREQSFSLAAERPEGYERTLEIAPDGIQPGLYRLELVTSSGDAHYAGQWPIVGEPPGEARAANLARLQAIEPASEEVRAAIEVCRARNDLLTARPAEGTIAQLVVDPVQLMKDLRSELTALERGEDPYVGLAGDSWQQLDLDGAELAVRILAPPEVVAAGEPVPLVVALHGAGGDENMFMEGYGAGVIKRLATERGWILVSPDANAFGRHVDRFDELVEAIAYRYSIDRARIYAVGHSMGAGQVAVLASRQADVLAAACCLAGGGVAAVGDSMAPTLVILPALDMVSPPAMVRMGVRRALAAGHPVELREYEHHGHTLVVPAVLPEIFEWFASHARPGAAPSPAPPGKSPPADEDDDFF